MCRSAMIIITTKAENMYFTVSTCEKMRKRDGAGEPKNRICGGVSAQSQSIKLPLFLTTINIQGLSLILRDARSLQQ